MISFFFRAKNFSQGNDDKSTNVKTTDGKTYEITPANLTH